MLKIWGRKNSVNVQKILWCCDELGIRYQNIDAGSDPAELESAAYRALNPNGLVPTIEDGEFVLWESNTILRYLAAKHGAQGLWSQNPEQRALADRWMDWQLSTLWARMRPLFIQLIRTTPEQRDPAIVQRAYQQTLLAFETLEAHLSANAYVAGAEFTLGDIPVGAVTYRWLTMPVERPPMPQLQAWYERLGTREAYRRHVMLPLS